MFHPSDVSDDDDDDDDDDDSDILWEAEPKNNAGSKIFSIFTLLITAYSLSNIELSTLTSRNQCDLSGKLPRNSPEYDVLF